MKSALYKLDLGSCNVPVRFVRSGQARRYILRLLPDGFARVTIPRGGSLQCGHDFLKRNRLWLEKQLAKAPSVWGEGTEVLLRGLPHPIRIFGLDQIRIGSYAFRVSPIAPLRPQIEEHLRMGATPELVRRTREFAAKFDLPVRRVLVRNQRSRWGSCSSTGTISLNWRLVQAPESVRDYIIVHELMHLKEMNHSRRFWGHVAAAFPAYEEAERWLRKNGHLLR